jgi:hypothetical protein
MMRIFVYTLVATFILAVSNCGFAQLSGRINGPFLKINDLWVVYTNPVMSVRAGCIFMPARYFAKAATMGIHTIKGDFPVQIRFRGRNLEIGVGKTQYKLNGVMTRGAIAPVIQEGRIMIPLCVVAKAFGLSLQWDASNRIAILEGKGLASDQTYPGDTGPREQNARASLEEQLAWMERDRGPEETRLLPITFEWQWKLGKKVKSVPPLPTPNSRFRLELRATSDAVFKELAGIGLVAFTDENGAAYTFGHMVPYPLPKDPRDRDYCRAVTPRKYLCDVPLVAYLEPDRSDIIRLIMMRAYK